MRLFYLKNKKIIYGFLAIIALYGLFIWGFIYFFVSNLSRTNCFLKEALGTNRDIGNDLVASMLEDIIFFGLITIAVTIVTLVISITKPEDNSFEIRLRSLANSNKIDIDDYMYQFLKLKILSFMAFNEEVTFNLEIRDYNAANNAFLIFTHVDFKITNMCKDVAYLENEVETYIVGDVAIDGSFGDLIFLGEHKKPIKEAEKLVDKEFRHKFPLHIQKNSEVTWTTKHKLWTKTGDILDTSIWSYFEMIRYSKRVRVNIKNKLSDNVQNTIKFCLKYTSIIENQEITLVEDRDLLHNSSYEQEIKRALYPKDRIIYYIYPI